MINKKLTGAGFSAIQAATLLGDTDNGQSVSGAAGSGVALTGTSQATAYPLNRANTNVVAVAAGAGAILPTAGHVNEEYRVVNQGGATMNVWPPLGGTIANASVNAAATVANNTIALFIAVPNTSGILTGLNWMQK